MLWGIEKLGVGKNVCDKAWFQQKEKELKKQLDSFHPPYKEENWFAGNIGHGTVLAS